jgi:hypothetical protein
VDGDGTGLPPGSGDGNTLQVNGNTASGDNFTISAIGSRIFFQRTNLGVFSLDVGEIETLIVNGIGGDDRFTVNDLGGATPLTTLNLNGFDGTDAFVFIQASAGGLTFNAHGGPDSDRLQGPQSATTWNVTAPNHGNIAGLVASFSFIEALVGGSASDTFNVKAFTAGTPATTGGVGPAIDTLNYNAEGRTVSGDTTPPDGLIDSPGVQSFIFGQIETVNIVNPPPSIAITDVTMNEGNAPGSAVFTVTLSNPSSLTVTVNFATADGTAVAPGDYSAVSGTLTFTPGQTSRTISVPIIGDTTTERNEVFLVNLTFPVNAQFVDGTAWAPSSTAMAAPTTSTATAKADLVVFRPASETWYILPSSTVTPGHVDRVRLHRGYPGRRRLRWRRQDRSRSVQPRVSHLVHPAVEHLDSRVGPVWRPRGSPGPRRLRRRRQDRSRRLSAIDRHLVHPEIRDRCRRHGRSRSEHGHPGARGL